VKSPSAAGYATSLKPVFQTSAESRQLAFRQTPNPAKSLQNSAESCRETAKSWIEPPSFSDNPEILPWMSALTLTASHPGGGQNETGTVSDACSVRWSG